MWKGTQRFSRLFKHILNMIWRYLTWKHFLIQSHHISFHYVLLHTTTNHYNLQYLGQLDDNVRRSNNIISILLHRGFDF